MPAWQPLIVGHATVRSPGRHEQQHHRASQVKVNHQHEPHGGSDTRARGHHTDDNVEKKQPFHEKPFEPSQDGRRAIM